MVIPVHIDKRRLRLVVPDCHDLAENDVVRRHFLDFAHAAIEGGKRVAKDGRARYQLVEHTRREAFVVGEQRTPRKSIRKRLMMRGQGIQCKDAAPKEDVVLRIAVVQAYQYGRRAIGYRASGSDRHASALLTDRRRYELHMAAKAAHRIPVEARVDRLLVQQRHSPSGVTGFAVFYNMKVIGYLFYKSQAKSFPTVRFSLTIDAGRIKEQDKRHGPAAFMNTLRGLALLPMLLLAAGECHAAGLTIGVVAPQTGNLAPIGAQIIAGATARIQQDGNTIVTVAETCEENSGAAIADALINAKVQVAVGFLCSETLEGALPKLKDANIPAITISVRSRILMEDALKNAWPLYRMAPADGAEAEKIIEVIVREWAASPIALVEDGTIHGRELTEAIRNALEEKGLKPVFTDTYRPGQEQQVALVRRLKKAGATKVFVGGDRSDVAVIARDAAAEKIQLDILGGDAMRAANQPLALADGVYAVALPDYAARPEAKSVVDALRAGGVEPEGYVLPAYAAVEIASKAVQDAGADDRPIAQHIGGTSFETIIGKIAFNAGHELADNPYRLLLWHAGSFVLPSAPIE